MSCSICNRAGHDEELHGEEGEELLKLRGVRDEADNLIEHLSKSPERVSNVLARRIRCLENALVEAGVREPSTTRSTELPSDTKGSP